MSKARGIQSPNLALRMRPSKQSDWLGAGLNSLRRSRRHRTGRMTRAWLGGTNAASFLIKASNAIILERALPGEKLLFGHLIAATSLLDRDHTAGHSRHNRSFSTSHPPPSVPGRQLDHRRDFMRMSAREHAAVRNHPEK